MSINYHLDLLNNLSSIADNINTHIQNIEDKMDDFDDNIDNVDQEKNKDMVSTVFIDKTKPISDGEILINYFQNKNSELKSELLNVMNFAENSKYISINNDISQYSPDTIYTTQDLSNILYKLSDTSLSNEVSSFLGKTIKVNVNGVIEDRYISTISGDSTINGNDLTLGYSDDNFKNTDVIEKKIVLTNIDYETNQVIEKEVTLLISKGNNDDIKFNVRFIGELGNTITKKIDITNPNSLSFNSLTNINN